MSRATPALAGIFGGRALFVVGGGHGLHPSKRGHRWGHVGYGGFVQRPCWAVCAVGVGGSVVSQDSGGDAALCLFCAQAPQVFAWLMHVGGGHGVGVCVVASCFLFP